MLVREVASLSHRQGTGGGEVSAEPRPLTDYSCHELTANWIDGPNGFGPTEMARRLRLIADAVNKPIYRGALVEELREILNGREP